MDRYNMVKLLLKNWEQGFVQQHQRKPSKEDIDQAPEETRKLYKEYRCLKQAKENSDAGGQPRPACEEDSVQTKDSECWGAHLNRSTFPAASPRMSGAERDSLKASAQYYGLKLKSNLATLSKDRPVSLRKSLGPGRLPLNSLKDGAAASAGRAETPKPESSLFSPRRAKPALGTPLVPVEPEEPFELFKPVTESGNEPADGPANHGDANQSCPGKEDEWVSAVTPAGGGSSAQLALPAGTLENNLEQDAETATALCVGSGSGGAGSFLSSRGSPLRGHCTGRLGKPSPASRLSLVDTKWLERCQVFGEMAAQERPGAGNQEIDLTRREGGREMGGKGEREKQSDEGAHTPEEGGGGAVLERQRNDDVDRISQDEEKTPKTARRGKRKESHLRELGERDETEGDPRSPKPGDPKKSGRKRRREGEEAGDGMADEEGDRKRRRGVKKKEENSGTCGSSPAGGARKKGRARKKAEDGDGAEEEKKNKLTKKETQENLLGETEDFGCRRTYNAPPPRARSAGGAAGNFVKINLKKKSHVKGYALRGAALRKQLYMQKFQLKGERFGGGGGYFGRGRRGGFRGGHSRQGDTCYKCGGTGHWAMECKGPAPPPPVPADEPVEEEPFELPTLEEVARATGTLVSSAGTGEERQSRGEEADGNHGDALLNVIRPDYERPAPPPPTEPLYPVRDDGTVQATPGEVLSALQDLGYQSFRPGQEEAIMRILSGLSTLVVLSTGMGKSLCYQLPAYLYAQRAKCITLVVSPLVSLMDDQLSGIPARLKAACIHSNMTMKQREAAIEKVKSGEVCVLLLSPEALVGGGGSGSGCLPSAQELPPVAFACIDEAHCVSEWSHNFRPCYLRLCKVLRERLGVRCLLGLTATATLSTALDIAHHLDISDTDGIAVRSAAVPSNLHLSVSTDREKDQALVSLLKGERFGCLDSVIVYCTRREETTRVAALLRTCLQGVMVKENRQISGGQIQSNPVGQKKKELARKKIRKPLKWQAESYHAGLSGSERRRVQNNFMCGELRIVVATVAFGMGLDKSDVRGIIHYNMPKSFESYVQEIGRAGRDGEPAHCHLFLNPEGEDLHELRRHIYADTVDYYTVKRLVQRVFPPCKCKVLRQKQEEIKKEVEDAELLEMMDLCDREGGFSVPAEEERVVRGEAAGSPKTTEWPKERACHTHERAVPIQETVEALDITEEGVETLLCYLELHPQRFVELLHPILSTCKVSCYDGPKQLRKITRICPPVAVVLARRRMAGERVEACSQLEFDVVEVADTMGWQLPLVKRGLRQLQWSTDQAGGRSGVHVEFSAPSFYFRSYGDLSDEEMDLVCRFLHGRVQEQERSQLYQLTACFQAFKSVAFKSASSCVDDLDEARSLHLKDLLAEYFEKRRDRSQAAEPAGAGELEECKLLDWEPQVRADIRSFLACRSDEKFSGRAVARILHGIGSPCYPAQTYGKDRRFWRKYIRFDFNQLIALATQEIIRFK